MFPNWKSQSSQEPKDSEDKKPAAALGWSSVARWEDVGGTYLWVTPHILGAQKQWLPASIFPYTNPWNFPIQFSPYPILWSQRCKDVEFPYTMLSLTGCFIFAGWDSSCLPHFHLWLNTACRCPRDASTRMEYPFSISLWQFFIV
jgi:hypothetical protein